MAILKPQSNGKYSENRKKTTPYKKTMKRILKPKYKQVAGGFYIELASRVIRLATLKIRLLVISKLQTISSNCGLRSSARQHSITQLLI